MKRSIFCACLALAAAATFTASAQEGDAAAPAKSTVQLADDNAKVSYSVGYEIGATLQDFANVDLDVVLAAIKDRIAGNEPPLTQDQMREAFEKVMPEVQANMQKRMEKEASQATSKNESWFAENAKKEGVKTGENGLQYKVITEGEGESPAPTDTVTVHYTGKLTNGTVFDSSVERGEPATFALNRVIPGWTQGLQLMKKGSKYELYIPAELGYGPQPPPQSRIPPNAILVFEVELLDIKKAAAAADPNEIVLDQKN